MSANFRLPSIAVSSPFEVEPVALTLPGLVESGNDPALAILEGAYRPATSACRFVYPAGMVGLQLPQGPLPDLLRVIMPVRADRLADEKWSQRVTRLHGLAVVRGGVSPEDVPDDEVRGRHRLVAVHAQGRLRAQALLAHDGGEDSWVRQRLVFDVATSELDETRLLLLSFTAAESAWGHEALPTPLVGVSVPRIRVREDGEPAAGAVSTGLNGEGGWLPYSRAIGFAVVNPATEGTSITLRIQRRTAAHAGRLLGRLRRSDRVPLAIEVVDSTGAPVPVPELAQRSPDLVEVALPAGHGPLHVRLTDDTEHAEDELHLSVAPRG